MKGLNELDDAAVDNFAELKKFDEVTVSIALLNEMPIEMVARLMDGPRPTSCSFLADRPA